MAKITVYTTERCNFCGAVKALLESSDLPFEEVNLDRDPEGRERLAAVSGMRTFPQVLVDDQPIGGFRETRAAIASGHLAQLLAA